MTEEPSNQPTQQPVPTPPSSEKPLGMEPNTYCMVLHLSLLAGFVVPLAGLIAPIVLWAIGKDKDPEIDAHGRMAINWIISSVIYAIIGAILIVVLIGIFVLIAVGILTIVFAIIAAVKAQDGQRWSYPLAITFLKPRGA